MPESSTATIEDALAQKLEQDLLERYGPILGSRELQLVMGYRSLDAFRQAVSRNVVPVPIFPIENRRGKFALTMEVARWLAKQRRNAVLNPEVLIE